MAREDTVAYVISGRGMSLHHTKMGLTYFRPANRWWGLWTRIAAPLGSANLR